MRKYLYIVIIALTFASCEEDPIVIPFEPTPESERVVIIEEVTGANCVNCPNAARQVKSIIAEFPDNVITVGYHVYGTLGKPFPESKYNFRTDEMANLINYIDLLFGVPAGAINRVPVQGNEIYNLTPDRWRGFVIDELEKPVLITRSFEKTYVDSTRELNCTLTFFPFEDINEPLYITAMIAESKIIDPQLDLVGVVPDYEHNHVMRAMLSPVEGKLVSSNFTKGTAYSENFTFTLPPEAGWWNAKNCEVIWFVHKNGSSKEILEASSFKIVEE